MERHYPLNPRPPQSCQECAFLNTCGGLEGEAFFRGCFQRCTSSCTQQGCDLACPCLHLAFPDIVEEVEGLCTPPRLALKPCQGVYPHYLPMIGHGSSRHKPLEEDVVVIPLTALLCKDRRGRLKVRHGSPEALRKFMRLAPKTRILVSSIAADQPIEDFWAQHEQRGLLSQLAALDLAAMTTPNFSFMRDVPRINTLFNLTRIFRIAERMTQAGIPTVLHLQACTRRDWARWTEVMRDQPAMRCVALEFQTGASKANFGDGYYCGLVGLQQAVGRSLHPFVIAGGGRIIDLAKDFTTFSVVDSTPFLKTLHRRALIQSPDENWFWRPAPSTPDSPLDKLLISNIANQREMFRVKAGLPADRNRSWSLLLPPAA